MLGLITVFFVGPALYFIYNSVPPTKLFTLPSLILMLILLWFVPQFAFLVADHDSVIRAYLPIYVVFLGVSWVALHLGFVRGFRQEKHSIYGGKDVYSAGLYRLVLVILITLSTALTFQYTGAIESNRLVSQWSGGGTIISFFSGIRHFIFPLGVLYFFQRRRFDLPIFLLCAVHFILIIDISLVELRRSELVGLFVSLAMLYFFIRERLPSGIFVFLGAFIVTTVIFGISELRSEKALLMDEGQGAAAFLDYSVLANINLFSGGFDSANMAPDIRNGIYIIAYSLSYVDFQFGAGLWNDFVWQYVPAQIVGSDVKEALIIGDRVGIYSRLQETMGYARSPGSTRTGLGSAFFDLGFLGFLYFWLIGVVAGSTYRRALGGDIISQALYIAICPLAMISYTHTHSFIFVTLPPILIVAWTIGVGRRLTFSPK